MARPMRPEEAETLTEEARDCSAFVPRSLSFTSAAVEQLPALIPPMRCGRVSPSGPGTPVLSLWPKHSLLAA